jgi:dynein heavy chain, axonemal
MQLKLDYNVLTGDMLLASAFVSYCGPFTSAFRASLNSSFLAFLKQKGTPMTEGLTDPLKVWHFFVVGGCRAECQLSWIFLLC